MDYEEIANMLGGTGLPFAYHHFAEGSHHSRLLSAT